MTWFGWPTGGREDRQADLDDLLESLFDLRTAFRRRTEKPR